MRKQRLRQPVVVTSWFLSRRRRLLALFFAALCCVIGVVVWLSGKLANLESEDDVRALPSAAFCNKPRPPLVCAHGGDTSAAPPNTKQAFLAAIAAHADCVEVDCARTSDGVLVVLHTRELQQLLGKRFVPGTQVGDLTSDEIRQLAWPGGQPVLSVRDAVLLTSPQVECVTLDVKTYQDSTGKAVDSEQVAAAVVQLVHDTRCSNCLVWAKTDEVVSLIKALSPGQRAGFILMNETADARAAGMHLPLRLQAPEVVGAHHAMVDEATLQLLRTHGKQLFTWTINDPKVMRRVLDVGVDALVTNKLAQAQEAIEWRMQLCGSVRG
ncbi:PLC-like phosphodiesterase [Haematococcus lacustris]